MAFTLDAWSKISASANTKAPTFYGYLSPEPMPGVRVDGYFDPKKIDLKVGNVIYVSVAATGVGGYFKVTNAEAPVKIAPLVGPV